MKRNRTRPWLALGALVVMLAVIAAACGGGDDDKDNVASPAAGGATGAGATAAAGGDAASRLASIKGDTTGVTDTEVKIGSYWPKTGGLSIIYGGARAIEAYFEDVNKAGGIHGRKVTFKIEDDAYVPTNTKNVVKKLIEQEQVFMLAGGVGTATTNAILDDLKTAQMPAYFLITGDAKFSQPGSLTTGLVPTDYVTEGTAIGKYAAANYKGKKAGIIYQNDDYGKQNLQGIKAGVGSDMQIVGEEGYEATVADWNSQATKLLNAGAEVMLVASTPQQFAATLKDVKAKGRSPVWISTATGASAVTARLSEGAMDGVIATQTLRDVTDPDPAQQKWRKWASEKNLNPDDTYVYLGVLVAQHVERLLQVTGKNLNRASLLFAMENLAFQGDWRSDLLLTPSIMTANDRKAVEYVFLSRWVEAEKKFKYELPKDLIDSETTKR